jgi:putative PIN family toxin of toxin-antitoxin system
VSTAVLDTNTIVSATIVPHGIPGQILAAAVSQRFVHITSAVIIAEVITTLSRGRIRQSYGISPEDIERVTLFLEHETVRTSIRHEVHGVATHPEDDLILATAVSAEADYLVMGDRKLQELGAYEGVTIASPRQFLEILGRGAE